MGYQRDRGMKVERAEIIHRFAPLMNGNVTHNRFLNFVADCLNTSRSGSLSENTIKKLWLGGDMDDGTLHIIARATGVDFRLTREEDALEHRMRRIKDFSPALSSRLFAPSDKTLRIQENLSQLETDVLSVAKHAHNLAHKDLVTVASAACQIVGSMQMFLSNQDEVPIRALWRTANKLAAEIEMDDEPLANKLKGILHWNWIGPRWRSWCHPEDELKEKETSYWLRRFEKANGFFLEASMGKPSPEHGALVVSRFRTIASGPNPMSKEAKRLEGEIFDAIQSGDRTNRAYALVVRSHRDFKLGKARVAIEAIVEAMHLYQAALGTDHRFVNECKLRLCELDVPTDDAFEVLHKSRESGVPNSCIVDLQNVEKVSKSVGGKKGRFESALRSLCRNKTKNTYSKHN